ncbi:hypothetical protein BK816_02455 [Boudabousia tangfeifanii]|uniref:THUMP-like domain-containing protein n=1 Tax=Boudabousia tangfeifanii TaxID=1912795 RepID=A0A1D9MJE4_9ACTO|nr:hypothetical protein [Boudabousia tangfeifanii]AOZ72300.1 hypothetical protein BK816_02455 [Boudabousia tangfeifanii]
MSLPPPPPLSPKQEQLLELTNQLPLLLTEDELANPLVASEKLRAKNFSPNLIASALSQWSLRQRAIKKLGPIAQDWFFTNDGLEQATQTVVARHHAQRFAEAGFSQVADLGCALGTESQFLAREGLSVFAVELDPLTASWAAFNLREHSQVQVLQGLAEDFLASPPASLQAVFADPARRLGGKRLMNPEDWSPPLSTALSWAADYPAGIKVAPGIDYKFLPPTSLTEFVSVGQNVVEACIWTKDLAPIPGRVAQVFVEDQSFTFSDPLSEGANGPVRPAPCGDLGRFILEPNGALVRSGLLAALADEFDLRLLDPQIAFLTTDILPPAGIPARERLFAAAQVFEVSTSVPLHRKQVAKAVSEAEFSSLEVYARGVELPATTVRKWVKFVPSGQPGVLFAARLATQRLGILAKKVSQ